MPGMTPVQQVSLLIPAAYVLGSVPFGLMVGKLKGVDPRAAGSGNIGASNVGRLLGRRFFVIVFLLDLLKGLLPMLAAARVLHGAAHDARTYLLWLLVGFAAIVGHMFSVFLGFKGGKGVATSSGVILGLFPYFTVPGIVALAVWAVVLKGTRYISVASIVAAVLFPATYVLLALVCGWPVLGEQLPLLIFSVLVAAMLVYKHRSNIARLRAGTEPRYDAPRGEAPGAAAGAAPRPASAA
jgi:glycerol-3-phosphate acyltransferase PlsY